MENDNTSIDAILAMTLEDLAYSAWTVTTNSSSNPNDTDQRENDGAGQNGKKTKNDNDEDDEEELQSVNLLLTQDEWSSSDNGEDDEDDEDFFGLRRSKQTSPSKTDTTAASSRNSDAQSVASGARAATDTATSVVEHCTPVRKTTSSTGGSRTPCTPSFFSKLARSPVLTPATQTLNNLSQQTSQGDLRYDMSQLGYHDARVADILVGLSQGSGGAGNGGGNSDSSGAEHTVGKNMGPPILSRSDLLEAVESCKFFF